MKCPRCQAQNDEGLRFCEECGTPHGLSCRSCGGTVPADKKFCGFCGSILPPPGADRFASIRGHTPQHLAEKILTSRGTLEGERKQITVLFADVRGSLELLAGRDPEEARQILDPALYAMMDAVHRYDGTVNQILGDGIMALFGAPVAHEDHAARACYAALEMQRSIRRYTEEVRRAHGVEVQIRVGLNSGEVVVRTIDGDLHMDYSAIGQSTHLAARMEQLATPGSIRLTAATLRLAEGLVEVVPLGPVPVKGLADPVEVFELVDAGSVRTRVQAAAPRGLTRFIGRQAEVETLERALETARARRGQVVAVVGEPGVGKSRLVWELSHSRAVRDCLILETGAVAYGQGVAYLPVVGLLKTYFAIEKHDDERKIREKVTGKLLTLDEALRPALPVFLALLEVALEDREWRALDPPQRRERILDAMKRLLFRESEVQPILLIFEDLHWVDTETEAFLNGLIDGLSSARVLFVVSYRPDYRHNWAGQPHYSELALDPLAPEQAAELLRVLVGHGADLEPLKHLLIERTEGNPFFLEESVRTLVETGVLVGAPGSYRIAKALPAVAVPATVRAVIAARIDRLPVEEKRLLQFAAVIGRDVPQALLRAITQTSEDSFRRRLANLAAAHFLYEEDGPAEPEYVFAHALTHEVAYASILHERRRATHALIVGAIESLYPGRLTEHVEQLAHHALRGEAWAKAVAYLRQAGAKAVARSANREAVACFEQALGALQNLPDSREATEEAVDIRFELRHALHLLGEFGRIRDCLRDAEILATALSDQRRLGLVSSYMTHYYWEMGDHERALEAGRRVLATAEALGDLPLQVVSNFRLGQVHYVLGEYAVATECLQRNVAALAGDRVRERFGMAGLPSVYSRTWLVRCLAELGEFREGIARGAEAIQIAEAADHTFSLIAAHWGLGTLYLCKGDIPEAIAVLERGLTLCRGDNLQLWVLRISPALGAACAVAGRLPEALHLLEQAVERGAAIRGTYTRSLGVAWLAAAFLRAGRLEEALHEARRALGLARAHRERGSEAHTLRLLAEIVSHGERANLTQSEAFYREALGLATALGMRPVLAQSHLGLGALYARIGKGDCARLELAVARSLFRSMEMGFWLGKAETVLGGAEIGVGQGRDTCYEETSDPA